MKKLIGMLMAVLMLTMTFACAEEFPMNEFVHLQDGDGIELGGETLNVQYTPGGYYNEKEYMLSVNDCAPATGTIYLSELSELMAVRYESGLYFFIGGGAEDGENNYDVYVYADGKLSESPFEFGYCDGEGGAETPRATEYGTFFVQIYDVTSLGGFTHDQEFSVVSENGACEISEVSGGMYSIGRVVEILEDLPLLLNREDGADTVMLCAGDEAEIVLSDCESWAYLAKADDPEACAGWVQLVPGSYDSILVGGEEVSAREYIGGIMIGG